MDPWQFSVPLPLTEHHLDRNAGAQVELAALDQRFAPCTSH
jgi:hypothetical protein